MVNVQLHIAVRSSSTRGKYYEQFITAAAEYIQHICINVRCLKNMQCSCSHGRQFITAWLQLNTVVCTASICSVRMWDVWKILVFYAKLYEAQEKRPLFKWSTIHYGLSWSWLQLYSQKIVALSLTTCPPTINKMWEILLCCGNS